MVKKEPVIEKRKVDEEEINAEIQKEIDRSKVRRTQVQQKEERKVIEHQPRYLETEQNVQKEFNMRPKERVTTYDVVNPKVHEYQDIDDSYIVRNPDPRQVRTTNITEPQYRPSRVPRPSRKSVINPAYHAEEYEDVTPASSYQQVSQSNYSQRVAPNVARYQEPPRYAPDPNVVRYQETSDPNLVRYQDAPRYAPDPNVDPYYAPPQQQQQQMVKSQSQRKIQSQAIQETNPKSYSSKENLKSSSQGYDHTTRTKQTEDRKYNEDDYYSDDDY